METLGISFIDYGDVRGSFCYSLARSMIELRDEIPITHVFRWSSSNIPVNRHSSLVEFYEESDADWLLCIDSDIVFFPDNIRKLWDLKSEEKQVISGVYFLLYPEESKNGRVLPAIFREHKGGDAHQYIHPLPANSVIEISRAGFGFVLLSRDVVSKVLASGDSCVFEERHDKEGIVGEDFIFFERLEKLGIKAYADTSNLVNHEKVINVDMNFYHAYWKYFHPSIYGVRND